jgi:hypothetical protein
MKRWNQIKTEEDEEIFAQLSPRVDPEWHGEKIDEYLMSLSKRFMKFKLNIFLLNKVRRRLLIIE